MPELRDTAPSKFWRIECPELDIDLWTGSGQEAQAETLAQAFRQRNPGAGREVRRSMATRLGVIHPDRSRRTR